MHFPDAGKGVSISTVPVPSMADGSRALLGAFLPALLKEVTAYSRGKEESARREAPDLGLALTPKPMLLSPVHVTCSDKKKKKSKKAKTTKLLFFCYHIWQHFKKRTFSVERAASHSMSPSPLEVLASHALSQRFRFCDQNIQSL